MSMPKFRTLAEVFNNLHGGAFAQECIDELKGLVKSVDETGKAGKLTITVAIKKAGAALQIDAAVTAKSPEVKPDGDLLWSTPEGFLTHQNPNQRSLDLQDATAPAKVLAG